MGATQVGVGAYPSPNLAQTLENRKSYSYIAKFIIRIHKQGLSRITIQGVLAESMVVSPKIDFSPSQVGV